MKVIFKDVPASLCHAMAESITHQLFNSISQYEDQCGKVCWYQHINTNQSIEISGPTVTVEGERCALWGDHHAEALRMLEQSGIEPSEYHTSDSRLQWHETLSSYMEGPRATFDESLRYCREKETHPMYFKALEEAWKDAERLRQYPLRATAEMSTERLQRAREVITLHEKQG